MTDTTAPRRPLCYNRANRKPTLPGQHTGGLLIIRLFLARLSYSSTHPPLGQARSRSKVRVHASSPHPHREYAVLR